MNISVLIPACNAAPFIREALESVRAQSLAPSEIIVLDDGSADGTAGIAGEYPDIRVITTPHRGVSAARNRLVSEASGDWIAFLDADDVWDPRKLEMQAAYVDAHPECSIVFCGSETFADPSLAEPSARQQELLGASYPYLLQASLIRKELFDRHGMFKEELMYNEDTDWMLRVLGSGVVLHKMPEMLCRYRIHGHNTMISADMRRASYLKVVAAALRNRTRSQGRTARLSVVIPAYNAGRYLREAVESVKGQEFPEGLSLAEILVVDDGSTDETRAIAEGLGGVTCIVTPHRCAAAARNSGIRAASGDVLLFLDADDVLTDGAVRALYGPLGADPGLRGSFGLAEDFLSPELSAGGRDAFPTRKGSYRGFFSGCAMIRRGVFSDEDTGLFDETLSSGETVGWMLRFRRRHGAPGSPECADVARVTVRRRIHENNTGRLHAGEERVNFAAVLRRRLSERKPGK